MVQQRTQLAVTDHVGPLVVTLGAALREVLAARRAEFAGTIGGACETLAGDATWSKLDETARQQILCRVGLLPPHSSRWRPTTTCCGSSMPGRWRHGGPRATPWTRAPGWRCRRPRS